MILNFSTFLYSIRRDSMSASGDSQNDFSDPSTDADPGTSPDPSTSSLEDPSTPSSHGLPKAATRARRKLNSDEEDSDFVPEEVLAKQRQDKADRAAKKAASEATSSRRLVRKEYASTEAMKAP